MKVSQDRIPTQNNSFSANGEMPYIQTSPLHARRRVQSILADNPGTGPDDDNLNEIPNNSAQFHEPESRGSKDTTNPNHYHAQPSNNTQYHTDSTHTNQSSQSAQNYAQAKHLAANGPSSPQRMNQPGPYQAVIVFLLLLMVLVIISIVYQLFFRPSQVQPAIAEESLAVSNQSLKAKPSLSSDNLPKAAMEVKTKIPENLSQSSPINSVTPRGETVAPPELEPDSPNNVFDENEFLLRSKIGGIGYWIQVGAFSSLNNANRIKQQLVQSHLESIIQEGKNGTSKVYRVRVGLYTSKEEAERIMRQLKNIDRSFVNSIIIRTEI